MSTIILSLVGAALVSVGVNYLPLLYPKYRPGSTVLVEWESGPIPCRYLRRRALFAYHSVQVLPGHGTLQGADGLVFTCTTRELSQPKED